MIAITLAAVSAVIFCCIALVKFYSYLKEIRDISTECGDLLDRTNAWRTLPEEQWKQSFEDPHTKVFLEETHASLERFIARFPEYTTEYMRIYAKALGMWKDWCIFFDYLKESYQVLTGAADEETKRTRKITCDAAIRKVLADFMENSAIIERHSFLNVKWYQDILMEHYHILVEDRLPPDKEDFN